MVLIGLEVTQDFIKGKNMKINDIIKEDENSNNYDTMLLKNVLDILVLYKSTGTNNTHINNIINELSKKDIFVYKEDLIAIIKNLGYSIDKNIIQFDGEDDVPDDIDMDSDNDGEEEGYDPVSQMAQDATQKRIK